MSETRSVFEDPDEVLRRFRVAVREALLDHKRAGNAVAVWQDGAVVIVPPGEINPDAAPTPFGATKEYGRAAHNSPRMSEPNAPDLPNIGVQMTRANLQNFPDAPLPPGFRIRAFADGDDPARWVAIIRGGETLFTVEDSLWERAFGFDLPAARERVFFVETDGGEPVGTVAAWYGSDEKADWGRIHWITMLPAFQGQGMGKAALAYGLHRLAALGHQAVYLETSTARLPALQMYLRFGFVPNYDRADAREAWASVAAHLDYPALRGTRG